MAVITLSLSLLKFIHFVIYATIASDLPLENTYPALELDFLEHNFLHPHHS